MKALVGPVIVLGACLCLASTAAVGAENAPLVFRGQLTAGGSAVNGVYDFEFVLFDSASDGTPLGSAQLMTGVNVEAGSFAITLELEPAPAEDGARWLEVGVRPSGTETPFTILAPRRELGTPNLRQIVPAGAIVAFGGSQAPNGWLMANGAAVSRSTYDGLFAAIGITYGPGNGTTTFNLPDLRQRFPLGQSQAGTGSTLGETGGAIDHSHAYTAVPLHGHSVDPPDTPASTVSHLHNTSTTWGYAATPSAGAVRRPLFDFKPDDINDPQVAVVENASHTHAVDIPSFASGLAGVVAPTTSAGNPPYLAVSYLIKY